MRALVVQCLRKRLHEPINSTSAIVYLQVTPIQRTLFTNTDELKRNDPYAILGISFGATTSDIKEAYKAKAMSLHPDVNKEHTPEQALKEFQKVQEAYNKLMDVKGAPHRDDLIEEWSFSVWRNSDIIAQDRTDVAGQSRKRPIKPATSTKPGNQWGLASLGHPSGGGNRPRRGEYISDDNGKVISGPRSSTVGTGMNKWVKKKKFKPWKERNEDEPSESKVKQPT